VSQYKNNINVDLSTRAIDQQALALETILQCLGGFGFNVESLYRHLLKDTNPLAPDNLLMISRGLLTGTGAPSSSRIHINGLSPLSGLLGSSSLGGMFGFRMYCLGINSFSITGQANQPVYLYFGTGGLEFKSAAHLWGLDTRETEAILKKEYGSENIDILTIGPAGENKVHYASIITGSDHADGRNGLGALMGAKNLKAVVLQVEPKKTINSTEQAAVVKAYIARLKSNVSRFNNYARYGSSGDILETNERGMLGSYNYQESQIENAEQIDGRQLNRFERKKGQNLNCPIECKLEVELQSEPFRGFRGIRPEYESIISLGSLCGVTDPEAVIYLSNLCNILGLDTISTGSVIAFAMELFQRKILTWEDTDGLIVKWGDVDVMEALIRQIAYREGLGKILSLGVKKAAEKIGRDANKYAYHVKGVEIFGRDPRGAAEVALAYAVSLQGGDYTSVHSISESWSSVGQNEQEYETQDVIDFSSSKGQGMMAKKCMLVGAIIDSLGLCKVPVLSVLGDLSLQSEARLIKAITGLDITPEALYLIGERILQMGKIINLRQGSDQSDDVLPAFFQNTPISTGPTKGRKIDLEPMVEAFYQCMNWDKKGYPTKEILQQFDLKI
jgi:aldehyde:ferredoxin oxidoreductase